MTEAMSLQKKKKKKLTEAMSIVKFSSWVFRVFMMTTKQNKTKINKASPSGFFATLLLLYTHLSIGHRVIYHNLSVYHAPN